MSAPGKMGGKRLTDELRKLAVQVHTVMDDGTQVTREEALAELVWKYALGHTEKVRDINGDLVEKAHPPVAWAMQYLFERMEGKAPNAMPDSEGGIKALDKVRSLTLKRLNDMAGKKSGPPAHKPKLELET